MAIPLPQSDTHAISWRISKGDGVVNVFRLIRSDLRRYRATGARSSLRIIFFSQGFWASCVYRISHYVGLSIKIPGLVRPLRFLCQVARKIMEIITGIDLPYGCCIGEGLYVGHFGNIIVIDGIQIGSNCNLSQGVTIGYGGRGETFGTPTIGNRVYIAANAIVIGKITIGDDVVIGAGAVVTKSIPPRAVVVGNPARISSYKGSFDFVIYDGMEEDPERVASISRVPIDENNMGIPDRC